MLVGSHMLFNCILLYTFPAMDIRFIPLKSFICFEAFLEIGIMMFSQHCLKSLFGLGLRLLLPACKESPLHFKASVIIASSEPGDLLFFIDFIAVVSSSFVKFDVFMFGSCSTSGMFDVSARLLELSKSSSKYSSHSFTNSSLFAGGSPFLLFTFVTLFMVDFPVILLCFFGFNTLADNYACGSSLTLHQPLQLVTIIINCGHFYDF